MEYRQPGASVLLSAEQVARLDAASNVLQSYPHTLCRQQGEFARLNPPLV